MCHAGVYHSGILEGDLHILTTNQGQATVTSHDFKSSQSYPELSLSHKLWSTKTIKSQNTPWKRLNVFHF